MNEGLQWIFRETHREDDFGIDGYIDVVESNGSVTGQSLAVQIKTGGAFLNEKFGAGYVFRGDKKHLNFYSTVDRSSPVIIILCDPKDRVCYFEHFSLDKVDDTGQSWRMIIPFLNRLGEH